MGISVVILLPKIIVAQGLSMCLHKVFDYLLQICLNKGVKYVVSPYESDAQIAYLVRNGYADLAITEDSDLLVYGCKKVRLVCYWSVCCVYTVSLL